MYFTLQKIIAVEITIDAGVAGYIILSLNAHSLDLKTKVMNIIAASGFNNIVAQTTQTIAWDPPLTSSIPVCSPTMIIPVCSPTMITN